LIGWSFHGEIQVRLLTAVLHLHVTLHELCINRRTFDPAGSVVILRAELRPLITVRKILPAAGILPDVPSPTVRDQRDPLFTLRKSKPAASHIPSADKHANPWGGISMKDYSPKECPTALSIQAFNTDPKKSR